MHHFQNIVSAMTNRFFTSASCSLRWDGWFYFILFGHFWSALISLKISCDPPFKFVSTFLWKRGITHHYRDNWHPTHEKGHIWGYVELEIKPGTHWRLDGGWHGGDCRTSLRDGRFSMSLTRLDGVWRHGYLKSSLDDLRYDRQRGGEDEMHVRCVNGERSAEKIS